MLEHRTPQSKALLSDAEKMIKELERKAYIDPEKAEVEKELGNELFKAGNYAEAIKHYSEAIMRNPEDPKYYSNRAACYTKLAAFDLGLKDCEKCLELDPKFSKFFLRLLIASNNDYFFSQGLDKERKNSARNATVWQSLRCIPESHRPRPQQCRKLKKCDLGAFFL
jgi:tetratricopeptide (TPR) repeat protein